MLDQQLPEKCLDESWEVAVLDPGECPSSSPVLPLIPHQKTPLKSLPLRSQLKSHPKLKRMRAISRSARASGLMAGNFQWHCKSKNNHNIDEILLLGCWTCPLFRRLLFASALHPQTSQEWSMKVTGSKTVEIRYFHNNIRGNQFRTLRFQVTILAIDKNAKTAEVLLVVTLKGRSSGICLSDNAKFFYAMIQRRKVLAKFKVPEQVSIKAIN